MSNRRLISTSIAAAGLTLIFAALVFAGSLGEPQIPAPPAPPPTPPAAGIAAPAVPPTPPAAMIAAQAVPPVPPVPAVAAVPAVPAAPAPPALPRHRHARIHTGDHNVRIVGETLVVESDGDSWVIEDRATVRRFREAVRGHEQKAREMARLVETMRPAIARAEEVGRELENDEAFRALERDLERDMESDIARALAQAEAAGRKAEAIMKRHESSLRQMERELERFEKEMDALEMKLETSGEDLEIDLEKVIDEAIEKGLAKRID